MPQCMMPDIFRMFFQEKFAHTSQGHQKILALLVPTQAPIVILCKLKHNQIRNKQFKKKNHASFARKSMVKSPCKTGRPLETEGV